MSATVLNNIAAGIAAVLDTIPDLAIVYAYEPIDLDQRPAATVDGPTEITRSEPDSPESQLGAYDWRTTWTLRIYVDVQEAGADFETIRALLGQVVAAIDANPTLGGTAQLGASVTRSAVDRLAKGELEYVAAECELHAWSLVS